MSGAGGDDPCVKCGEPTVRQGDGFRFSVNREQNPDGDGWLCMECAADRIALPCQECGDPLMWDDWVRVYEDPTTESGHFDIYCEGCHDPNKHGPREGEA